MNLRNPMKNLTGGGVIAKALLARGYCGWMLPEEPEWCWLY